MDVKDFLCQEGKTEQEHNSYLEPHRYWGFFTESHQSGMEEPADHGDRAGGRQGDSGYTGMSRQQFLRQGKVI